MPAAIQQPLEPLRRARRLHADPRPAWQGFIELPHLLPFVTQSPLHHFPRDFVQSGDLLIARVKIATYNPHRSAPFLRALVVSATKSTRAKEPTPSWNQAGQALRPDEFGSPYESGFQER